MAPYIVCELESREELDEVVELIFKAQYSPYLPSVDIYFPVFGYTDEAHRIAVSTAQDRLWKEKLANPSDSWIFVRDEATKQIVGNAVWQWNHDGSRWKNGIPKIDCYWWPDVEAKKFCEEMLRQVATPRTMWMQRPHASLTMMVVHPEHRKRGVGSMMMTWGNVKIDEMGIESFIEAGDLGRTMYEAAGYITVMKISCYIPSDKRPQWNKYAFQLNMQDAYCMWRPKGGKVQEGGRQRPWQLVEPLQP